MAASRLVFGTALLLVPVGAIVGLALTRDTLVYELGEAVGLTVAGGIFVASLPFCWLGFKLAWNALAELSVSIDGEDVVAAERLSVQPFKTPAFPTWSPRTGYTPSLAQVDRPFHVGDVVAFKLGLQKELRSGLVVGVRLEETREGAWRPIYMVLPEHPVGGTGRSIRLLAADLAHSRTPTKEVVED